MKLPIRVQLFVLLASTALVPVMVVVVALLPRYGDAVREVEKRNQLALIDDVKSELKRDTDLTVHDMKGLADTVALASELQGNEAEHAELLIRQGLATRSTLAYVRLEIPDAKVDTILAKQGIDTRDAPKSKPELRKRALENGSAFALVTPALGMVVVPIPRALNSKGPQGFLTCPMFLRQYAAELARIVERLEGERDGGAVALLDDQGRLIAGHNVPREPGQLANDLPVFSQLQPSALSEIELAAATEFKDGGEPMLGTIRSVTDLGWTVAHYRPVSMALKTYRAVQVFAYVVLGVALALVIGLSIAMSRILTRPILVLTNAARAIGRRQWGAIPQPVKRNDELGTLSTAMMDMARDLEQGEAKLATEGRLRDNLSRFLSRELVERVVRGEHAIELGGARSEITVLFVDMVAFTHAAERMSPERVLSLLNELFTMLSAVVFRHGGVIDKFIGDCLMAIWGAPEPDPKHAARAVAAANDMMRFLEVAADGFRQRYGIEVRIAIGLCSGQAIVGNIGSRSRMDFTAVGDVVNIASRLESIAAPNQILASGSTVELARGFSFRRLGERNLAGRSQPVSVYELVQDLG